MEKRRFLKLFGATAWITPVITSVSLPLHAATSSGIMISANVGVVPNFVIMISDDEPNFSYSYQVNGGSPIVGDSGSDMDVTINDAFTGNVAGSVQEITVSVEDSDGNTVQEPFSFTIEG